MIDLVALAPEAEWFGSAPVSTGGIPQRLDWGVDAPTRRSGFAHIFDRAERTEDGVAWSPRDLLHVHPPWTPGGLIIGIYPEVEISPGMRFRAHAGLLEQATGSSGLRFEVGLIDSGFGYDILDLFDGDRWSARRNYYRRLWRRSHVYQGELGSADVLLEDLFFGRPHRPVVIVGAGTDAGQDWGALVRPRLERVPMVAVTGARCMRETSTGVTGAVQSRRRRFYSDEFALFVNMLPLDEDRNPVGPPISGFRVETDVDSGDPIEFPDIRYLSSYEATRYVEVRLMALELEGAGRSHAVAEERFAEWNQSFQLDGDRLSFSSVEGAAAGRDHQRLAMDFFEVDIRSDRLGGRDPVTVVGPRGEETNVDDYLNSRGIDRSTWDRETLAGVSEFRQYWGQGDSRYQIYMRYE